MREAIKLSAESVRSGGGPFGAVIVRDGEIIARGENRVTVCNDPTAHAEVSAIREAAARVRARTREKCLFFVISDGAPCEPTRNVKEAVRELSRDGFSFVSIGIDFEYDPSEMYDNHVSMTDLSTLAPELGKMIKKAIMDNSNRK